jgi:hypothetical protein
MDGSSSEAEDLMKSTEAVLERQLKRRELGGVVSSWILLPGLVNAWRPSGAAAAEVGEPSLESLAPPAKAGLIESTHLTF